MTTRKGQLEESCFIPLNFDVDKKKKKMPVNKT